MSKKIVIGGIFVAFLFLLMPVASSINENAVIEKIKTTDENCEICPSSPYTLICWISLNMYLAGLGLFLTIIGIPLGVPLITLARELGRGYHCDWYHDFWP